MSKVNVASRYWAQTEVGLFTISQAMQKMSLEYLVNWPGEQLRKAMRIHSIK